MENDNLQKIIGANIRRLRMLNDETQQQLGEYIGYGPTTVANYESGYRLPDLETFIKIAFHYKASIDDFLLTYNNKDESQ